ncbi:MAG: hypothetical protein DAHOPDDO_00791 [Ignavibacteriaceae bacterium]|nr:hypothetical protein [Ignavibacteriaceae bacterium]
MERIEISVFEIHNLIELSCKYRLYRIVGLSSQSYEFDKNVNLLTKIASSKSISPCISTNRGNELFVAQPDGYKLLPKQIELIRNQITLELLPDLEYLDFKNLDTATLSLAERFIQFQLQDSVMKQQDIWRPRAGAPFFNKTPDPDFATYNNDIDLYYGFSCRAVSLQGNKLGVAVDKRTKYLSKHSLPSKITPELQRKIIGAKAVYEYGKDWFEIKIIEKGAQNSKETIIDDKPITQWVAEQYRNIPKTQSFNELEDDCDTIVYLNSSEQRRYAPTSMCKICIDTETVGGFHKYSILPPHIKRRDIYEIVKNRLNNIYFNGVMVNLSQTMTTAQTKRLAIPSLLFGNNRSLTVSQLPSIKYLGSTKQQLLYSEEAGFYSSKLLDEQYLVLPNSVLSNYGNKFVDDLKSAVNKLYGKYSKYEPTVLSYDDTGKKSVPNLANKIFSAIDSANVRTGFAVVMVPNLKYSKVRSEDELANAIMSKLREKNIHSSVIHTEVCNESFIQSNKGDWIINTARKGKYSGYLRNVALTKVLLLNEVRPFILKDNLISDLVISIDVKNNVAGFTVVSKNGEHVKFKHSISGNKELLSAHQIKKYLIELLETFQQATSINIQEILIVRDGKLFNQEKDGINEAIIYLKNKNILSNLCGVTFLGIRKTSLNPIRLFRVEYNPTLNREFVSNPMIGTVLLNDNEAYLMTTGFPYQHDGTSLPLHLTYYEGTLSFEEAVQDIFSLTNLTWTKIDDCSREPLPIKYCDLQLRSIAGDFDSDEIEFHIPEEVEI